MTTKLRLVPILTRSWARIGVVSGLLAMLLITGCRKGQEPVLDDAAVTALRGVLEDRFNANALRLEGRSATQTALAQHRAHFEDQKFEQRLLSKPIQDKALVETFTPFVKMYGFRLGDIRLGQVSSTPPLVPKPERTTGYPYRAPDVLAEHPIAIKLVGGDLERLRGLSESLKGQSIPLIDLVRALRTEDGFTLTGTLYRRRDVRAAPVVYAPPSPTQIAMEAGLTASLNWTHQPELKALLAKLTEQQRSMTEWHHEMDEATRLGRLRQTFRVRSKTIAARPAPSVVALPAASP